MQKLNIVYQVIAVVNIYQWMCVHVIAYSWLRCPGPDLIVCVCVREREGWECCIFNGPGWLCSCNSVGGKW